MDFITKFIFNKLVAHNKFEKIELTTKEFFKLSAKHVESKKIIKFADYQNKSKAFLITNIASH